MADADAAGRSRRRPGRRATRRRLPTRSSSCPCATPCCFPAWCCRSPSGGRARSRPRSRRMREQRQLGILMQRNPEVGRSAPRRHASHRLRRQPHALRHRAGRHAPPRLPGRAALPGPGVPRRLAVPRRPRRAHPRARVAGARRSRRASSTSSARPSRPWSCCRRRRPTCSSAIQSITSPGPARRPRRRLHGPEGRRRSRRSWRPSTWPRAWTRWRACSAQRIEVLRLSQEIGRQTQAALDERQREVLLREQLAAIRRELGEGEEGKAEIAELGEAIAKAQHAEGGGGPGAQGAAPAGAHARGLGRARHGAQLPRLADRAALGAARGGAHRHRRGAPHPGRGPLRPRQDQAAHHRVSGRAQAGAARQGADPVPGRARRAWARPRSGNPSRAPWAASSCA